MTNVNNQGEKRSRTNNPLLQVAPRTIYPSDQFHTRSLRLLYRDKYKVLSTHNRFIKKGSSGSSTCILVSFVIPHPQVDPNLEGSLRHDLPFQSSLNPHQLYHYRTLFLLLLSQTSRGTSFLVKDTLCSPILSTSLGPQIHSSTL